MRIGVNTRWLIHNKLEGIGTFTHELLSRLVKEHPNVHFDFYFDRPFHASFIYANNVQGHQVQPPARHPYLWYIWYEIAIKRQLKKTKPNLFFSPDGFIPTSGTTKTLNTIHDLNFEHHPEWIPKFAIGYYKKYFPLCAEKADHLITVSEFSKRDICETYSIDPTKVDVVYNGANPVADSKNGELLKQKDELVNGNPYFIFIGALNPRKNLKNIFKAFDKLDTNHNLLVVGEKMHWNIEIENTYNLMQKKEKVIFSGRVEKDFLHVLLGDADAMVFPSLFEGFGIPILEAFQAGTAVITGNSTAMPEVADEAAILVNASSPESILNAMRKLAKDQSLRENLVQKGFLQAKKFSWENSATKLWNIMLKTMEK